MPAQRVILWVSVWLLAGLAAVGVGAFAFGGYANQEVLLSVLLVAATLILSVPGALMLSRRRSRFASWIAVGLLFTSCLAWMVSIWGPFSWATNDAIDRVGWAAFTTGLYALHVALLSLLPLRDVVTRLVRTVAWACAGVPLCVLYLMLIELDGWMDEWMARLIGALLVCSAACTLLAPVLWRLHARRAEDLGEHTLGGHVAVDMICPRCGGAAEVPANTDARCRACGLGLRVTFQEPRCECGYLLYGLTEPTCPECGRSTPEAHQWLAPSPEAAT